MGRIRMLENEIRERKIELMNQEIIRNFISFINKIMVFLLLSVLLSLSSCASYAKEFQCQEGKGLGCTPASKVIELLEDDKIDDAIAMNNQKGGKSKNNTKCKDCRNEISEKKEKEETKQKEEKNSEVIDSKRIHFSHYHSPYSEMISRSGEQVVRIWLRDYVDSYGNFNGEQIVYVVTEPSTWVWQ